jgi:hypothetical protein
LGGQFVGAEQHFQPLHMASFIFYLALQANNRSLGGLATSAPDSGMAYLVAYG